MELSLDRISGLPEALVHHILSFHPTEDVIRTATSCKRLNHVWTTLSYLNLDLSSRFFPLLPDEEEEEEEVEESSHTVTMTLEPCHDEEEDLADILRRRQNFIAFVERTLTRWRMQNLTAQKFRLTTVEQLDLDRELRQHMDRWLLYLVNCNIKELVLEITVHLPERRYYALPPVLLTATFLRALSLKHCKIPSGSIALSSLRKLNLNWVRLDNQFIVDIFNTCHDLEDLNLSHCSGFGRQICVPAHPQLKYLKFTPLELFDVLLIEAPYLERLRYYGGRLPSKMNLLIGESLKLLRLCSVDITHTQLSELVSRLPCLQELMLAPLNLKSIEISSSSLRRLIIDQAFDNLSDNRSVNRFGEITIDTPNLVYFRFEGCLSSVFRKSLAIKEVRLNILEVRRISRDEQFCSKLMQFLHVFDYSEVVTLKCSFFEHLIFPVATRVNLVAPFAHINHLKLEGSLLTSPITVLTDLVESLLWISPNLDRLSLEKDQMVEDDDGYHRIELFMEFASEVSRCDCINNPGRCWRHCLSRLIVKLEGADAEVCRWLRDYYTRHAERLEYIEVPEI